MQWNKKSLQEIESIASQCCLDAGCFLYDLEYNGPSRMLRVYIDSDEGVSLDHCSEVSRTLSDKLDQLDLGDVPYELEVSSPGVERPLKQLWHFEKACNSKIELKLQQSLGRYQEVTKSLEKAKNLIGKLIVANSEFIELEVESGKDTVLLKLPMDQITKANMVFEL